MKKVAVIGARGIGRHHGNWWTLEGAEVCAFAATTPESVACTREKLAAFFGFSGRGYTDVSAMLREEKPDIVDVCSPPACHAAHVRMALEAGCSVLCEKPFVFDTNRTKAELLSEAEGLIRLAEERGCLLGLCTQYSSGAHSFLRLWEKHHPGERITRYEGRLESPAKGRTAEPVRVWVDLAPHVISVFTAVFPGAEIAWESLETAFEGYSAHAAFDAVTGDGVSVKCGFGICNRTEPPDNIRRFRFNDMLFDVQGYNDERGVFNARIVTPEETSDEPDMMRLLIRDFLAGRPLVSGEGILENMRLLLEILEHVEMEE